MNILLVEDDKKIAAFIKKGLSEEYHSVYNIDNAEDALYLIQQNEYDIVILDWMLPDKDGLSLLKQIRLNNEYIPIIMLTARCDLNDKIEGIEAGADDYMTKPFAFKELLVRIKALHRRKICSLSEELTIYDLILDRRTHQVTYKEKNIDLTTKEYKLLELLVINKGKTVINSIIIEEVWGIQEIMNSNIVNVTIYNLRKKIGVYIKKDIIKTVRSSGYKIDDF